MPHEIHEQIEHAGHGEHGGGPQSSLPRFIGITIAMLGVLMALCSAQLGSARTELISTMVDENNAKGDYTARATKYSILQGQLQQLHSAMPDIEFMLKKDHEFKDLESQVSTNDSKHTLVAVRLQSGKILNCVVPTPEDVKHFLEVIDRTREENKASLEWAESYHDAVQIHKDSAEYFEYALLAAEIAVVIASVALLLAKQVMFSRGAFVVAVVLGVISLSIAGRTFFKNSHDLHAAEEKIHHSHQHYTDVIKDEDRVKEDKKLEDEIRETLPKLKQIMSSP